MRAQHHEFLGFFPPANFRHHIFGRHRTADRVGHLEMNAHRLPARQKSRHALRIFPRHHRLRHFFQLAIHRHRVPVKQQVRPRRHPQHGLRAGLHRAIDDRRGNIVFRGELVPGDQKIRMHQYDRAIHAAPAFANPASSPKPTSTIFAVTPPSGVAGDQPMETSRTGNDSGAKISEPRVPLVPSHRNSCISRCGLRPRRTGETPAPPSRRPGRQQVIRSPAPRSNRSGTADFLRAAMRPSPSAP